VNQFPTISETFIINKAIYLSKSGLDISIIVHSAKPKNNIKISQINELNFQKIHYLQIFPGKFGYLLYLIGIIIRNPIYSIGLFFRSLKLYSGFRQSINSWILALPLVKGKFDIIHFEFSGIALVYMESFPLLKPVKLITSARGFAEQIKPIVEPKRKEKLKDLFTKLDKIHCVSIDMQNTLVTLGASIDKTFINYPSIDTSFFQCRILENYNNRNHLKLISVGRLHWKKGFIYLLQSIRILIEEGYNICLDIVGSGQEYEALLFDINELGLTKHINLLGSKSLNEIRDLLESSDIYIQPSLSEGLSNATLEAMSMKLPVISTSVGGMAEVIDDGINGYLVSSRNPEHIAEKIKLLINNPSTRQNFGTKAREKVISLFDLSSQTRIFLSEYQKLIAK